jgi:hypothetical protein
MAVSRSGDVWRGETDEDLAVYVRSFRAGGLDVTETRGLVCPACAATTFGVMVDDEEGVAVAGCLSCGSQVPIGDSAEHLADAALGECACPCGNESFSAVLGYAMTPDREVRWLSVGLRCQSDDALGVYADWKIDYIPTAHLVLPPP